MNLFVVVAAALLSVNQGGVSVTLESETKTIDPAKNVFVTLTVSHSSDTKVALPDLRERVRGFSQTEDFAEEPFRDKDGRVTTVVRWMLVPEPCAKVYKIAPFAVGPVVAGPVYFESPAPREVVTGEMEVDPKKDLPPLSWKLFSRILGAIAALSLLSFAVWRLAKFLARKVKEHRMSPIERAWVELDRLLQRGLPGRGRYKDFYVELTMVVRRYVQRKYGIRAPHLTTEEFLREVMAQPISPGGREQLSQFLESADLVKFAGLEATPEMADEATNSARNYLKSDTIGGEK